ncbi:MAG: multidrug ABC transporter [Lachnospiraceae bacterium]|nr:multidrug ABC transporter [Lachnospiraceae bacterium]
METFLYGSLILLGTFISAISQVMLKKASQKHYESVIQEYCNPLVIFAYGMFFGATILAVLAYRGIPLSMGPVLEATSYIYVTIFGVKIFHEKVNRQKILALVLIVAGIVIYSLLG